MVGLADLAAGVLHTEGSFTVCVSEHLQAAIHGFVFD
jgi:hypothetical protein